MQDPHADLIAGFEVWPDAHCLCGLRFLYTVSALATERLLAGVRAAFPHDLVESTEPWGPVHVHHLVVQFRFELQLGPRPDEISFTHRVLASPAQRARDRAWFEITLLAASTRPEDA
ncbi:MAG: hypothetical protein H7138_25995 [Myxococcales bacterium]|nr:hypothetical protein [Myxococcales bacterium]